ncbi:MAG: GH92 family glycosyl hydrolase [Massilibacteroides sp.]|nr:GH92 family glycosyl hydrolase [Massilibacteroides sp.]
MSYSPEAYVDPLIGTDIRTVEGKDKNSTEERGQVIPAVGVPHGMTNWVAQTEETEQKCRPPYYYFQDRIQGFRASHWMNGSCTQDYGSVTIMPLCGKLRTGTKERASRFSHEDEVASPSYYSVFLEDENILSEMTGLSHSGVLRFTFEDEGERFIVIEPNSDEGMGYLSIDPKKKEIIGYNPAHRIYQGWGMEAGFSGHFVIRFEDGFEEFGVWENGTLTENAKEIKGNKTQVGAWVKFTPKSKEIVVRIGTSFTSAKQAARNLSAEIGSKSFDRIRHLSSDIWNEALEKVQIKGGTEDQKIKFYTALYSTQFLPRTFSDTDGSYPRFDSGKEILNAGNAIYYCDFSQWDTYRAVHPLFTILDPKRDGDMARSLVLKAEQGGWLPIFPSWNSYTSAMIGDHCIAMLSDAIIKDVPGFDYETAYRIMRKNAFEINTDSSYRDGKGRRAMESYLKYNFIPLEDEVRDAFHKKEQVSRTLEYAYDDFVLAQVAKKLGKEADYLALMQRAQNYRNVIDPKTGYARGRYADGRWITDFDPNRFVSYICEGTPYHYTWYVPQDVAGLMEQMGGKERFIHRLDTFFENGYYWHGNEPGHHIPYLFAYAGEPWKTQYWIHEIINSEYFTTPDGQCGNEDAGQMSAWLVFSMMGFYPVCPGMPYYVIGSPTFEECTLHLDNGNTFTIHAQGASDKNIYIQSAQLNGETYDKSFLRHEDIINGGELTLILGNTPNKTWASHSESLPPSLNP